MLSTYTFGRIHTIRWLHLLQAQQLLWSPPRSPSRCHEPWFVDTCFRMRQNFPVSAKSMLCLLERELDETTVVNFLNMDVINSFSAVLAARFPLCSITSTYVVVWALHDWTSMEIKCSRLLQIDFDNDNIFFKTFIVAVKEAINFNARKRKNVGHQFT